MIPKFRAWDKEQLCWINIATLNFDGEFWYLAPAMDDFNPVYYESELGEIWELMQSTGLKDLKGVEIFEGDVVWIIDKGEMDNGWGWFEEVKLRNGSFMAGDDFLINSHHRCVVHGNIYENPELLEESK